MMSPLILTKLEGLSAGAIAGITIGAVVFVLLILTAFMACDQYNDRKVSPPRPPEKSLPIGI